ncbi:hypothetical protein F7725_022218 [Dissostichus mawsoni]|uniref:PWWP domain-containing protein n=1 Tax=Dissostichus mawsoni TaxID=36200 RepID=A0A7J5YY80_DISMA|nr:hypothetical protein F7725_022218 [Dissostichus mawsoni]
MEDDQQLDQVYRYLNELYTTAEAIAPCLHGMESMQLVSFVLDVLLPEEFHVMIERHMRNKFQCQSTSPDLLDDRIIIEG